MFQATRGIVFRQTRYSDTSLVARILTEESGLRSYIVKGAHRPKARIRASIFQPLTLLDMVVSHKEKADLQHIREVRIAYPFQTIPADIRKTSILLFLNELFYKSIQEEASNQELFRFIYDNLILLDQSDENPANFHISMALHLSHFLGFFPQGHYSGFHTVFDLAEGTFTESEPLPAENFISGEVCSWFAKFLTVPVERSYVPEVSAVICSELLEKILRYYHLHLPLTGVFKSHKVLHEVLR